MNKTELIQTIIQQILDKTKRSVVSNILTSDFISKATKEQKHRLHASFSSPFVPTVSPLAGFFHFLKACLHLLHRTI